MSAPRRLRRRKGRHGQRSRTSRARAARWRAEGVAGPSRRTGVQELARDAPEASADHESRAASWRSSVVLGSVVLRWLVWRC
eukprot:12637841-Alexandrium_andersonii.AAC.1